MLNKRYWLVTERITQDNRVIRDSASFEASSDEMAIAHAGSHCDRLGWSSHCTGLYQRVAYEGDRPYGIGTIQDPLLTADNTP